MNNIIWICLMYSWMHASSIEYSYIGTVDTHKYNLYVKLMANYTKNLRLSNGPTQVILDPALYSLMHVVCSIELI